MARLGSLILPSIVFSIFSQLGCLLHILLYIPTPLSTVRVFFKEEKRKTVILRDAQTSLSILSQLVRRQTNLDQRQCAEHSLSWPQAFSKCGRVSSACSHVITLTLSGSLSSDIALLKCFGNLFTLNTLSLFGSTCSSCHSLSIVLTDCIRWGDLCLSPRNLLILCSSFVSTALSGVAMSWALPSKTSLQLPQVLFSHVISVLLSPSLSLSLLPIYLISISSIYICPFSCPRSPELCTFATHINQFALPSSLSNCLVQFFRSLSRRQCPLNQFPLCLAFNFAPCVVVSITPFPDWSPS